MAKPEKQSSVCDVETSLSMLEVENQRLAQENRQLVRQAEGVAAANAHAAELMVELEEANDHLKSEMSKREELETQLRKANVEMEQRVIDRTSELERANEQLQKEVCHRTKVEEALERLNEDLKLTVRMLKRSNQQLQDFFHIAAHDLKTPLRGIGTLAEWIVLDCGEQLDERGRGQIELLMVRVRRMDKMINAMLDYSQIQRIERREKQVDMNVLVEQVIAETKDAEDIEILVENKLPTVMCDQEHLARAFTELLNNSVEYADKAKKQIKISCTEEAEAWRFRVTDNGEGIEEKYHDRIFGIFQILAMRDDCKKIGIGLAVVKKIAELYGGKTWVESVVGQGSTFVFELPKAEMHMQGV